MFSIRYGVVSPGDISDRIIVYNPKYGQPIGPYGSRSVDPLQEKFESLKGFYDNLETSIVEEGIRDPVFCYCFYEGTYCKFGSSRLWVAKKHTVDVPAIIADYDGRWNHLEKLSGEDAVRDKFTEQPSIVEIEENWMRIDECRQ